MTFAQRLKMQLCDLHPNASGWRMEPTARDDLSQPGLPTLLLAANRAKALYWRLHT